MKLILESTDKIVQIGIPQEHGGPEAYVPARIWQGTAIGPKGEQIECHAYLTRVAVKEGQPPEAYDVFKSELTEHAKMRPDIQCIPLRMIL